MTTIIELNGKKIGGGQRTYIIAEAGLNHNGDVKLAKKLVKEALRSGADAIKFQTYKTENFLTRSSKYFKFFKNVELEYKDFNEIKNYAEDLGITFFSSPFDIESATYLYKIGVPFFKIATSDLTNMPLIKHIAKMKLPILISTGISTLLEIRDAIKWCISKRNNKIALLHCVANYPTQPEEANILAINTLKRNFNYPIGYSDNGESVLVDLVAVSLGANIIEKHFTLNKKMSGPDHSFSIDPKGLKNLILQIRLIEKIKGDGRKIPQMSEINNKSAIRKSITAKEDIQKGERLSIQKLSIKRPVMGLEPKYFDFALNKKVNKTIKKDNPIQMKDLD